MAFQGTQTKCKVCGKTVYPMEQLTADGVIYHRGCFRCAHCKTTLKLNAFASLEGVLYCKPHFEQLFKKTGSYDKSFEEAVRAEREKPPPTESISGSTIPSKEKDKEKKPVNPLASRFGGTQEKCVVCTKTVYPLEKVSVENQSYHHSCFKCTHAACKLTAATYRALHGKLYCKHHFNQLFMTKGNYSALTSNGAGATFEVGAAVSGGVEAAPKAAAAAPSAPAASPKVAPRAVAPAPTPPKPAQAAKKKDDSDSDYDSDSDDDKPAAKPAPRGTPAAQPSPAPSRPAPAAVPVKSPAKPAAKKDDSDSDSDSESDSDDDKPAAKPTPKPAPAAASVPAPVQPAPSPAKVPTAVKAPVKDDSDSDSDDSDDSDSD